MDWQSLKEDELKAQVFSRLSPDFRMLDGDDHPCYNFYSPEDELRPDFICYPKAPLLAAGWPKWMFYIECKDATITGAKRCNQLGWQAKTYMSAVYEYRIPAFVLVFLPFSLLCDDVQFVGGFEGYMQRERVGQLFFSDYGAPSYRLKMGPGVIYNSEKPDSVNTQLLARNHNGVCK